MAISTERCPETQNLRVVPVSTKRHRAWDTIGVWNWLWFVLYYTLGTHVFDECSIASAALPVYLDISIESRDFGVLYGPFTISLSPVDAKIRCLSEA